jgi:hypothetical protein
MLSAFRGENEKKVNQLIRSEKKRKETSSYFAQFVMDRSATAMQQLYLA